MEKIAQKAAWFCVCGLKFKEQQPLTILRNNLSAASLSVGRVDAVLYSSFDLLLDLLHRGLVLTIVLLLFLAANRVRKLPITGAPGSDHKTLQS